MALGRQRERILAGMPFLRRDRPPADGGFPSSGPTAGRRSPRGRASRIFQRWTIPVIGGITPVLVIIINIAEFISKHLNEFRWTVTVLAFVSGLMFNAYFALNIYRFLARWLPNNPVVRDENQELILVLGMAGVTAFSAVGAYALWVGLGSAADLPNKTTFLYGTLSILFPIVLQEIVRRFVHRDTVDGQ